ncbi:MAG TPA: DEAD/DEAH box helicase [Ignavibacteriaceae bacterium]|nr:DEAD/DEAH box helicase [Ignavibacteriaceae bacterium]
MKRTFEEIGVEKNILQAINELGFENPMPVQEEVIPILLERKGDIVALAQTGTGKTAAFGLPIIQNTERGNNQTQFLILSPTRELCLQIADDLSSFSKYTPGIKIAAVFGGASIERQIKMIKKGVHIISATPGRLIDLINRKIVNLKHINTLVLDEADEMLNMGFREELEEILKETPANKNTLLFSATMPKEVKVISKNFMKNPVEITIGKMNSGAENIKHICYMVHAKDRYHALKRIVDAHPEIYGIVFCRTRKETQEVAEKLVKDGYDADSIHGDLSQQQRDSVMNKFRVKSLQLLIATDVAARGIDVDSLTHIINYNLPDEIEIYTHRSGRTGRAGREGTSIIIANMHEKSKLYQIEKLINKKFEFLPVPSGKDICKTQLMHLVDRMEKIEVDDTEINAFLPEILKKLEWLDREELIKKFVSVEFNRFIDYYKNLPDLNTPAGDSGRNKRGGNQNGYARFFINLGRMDEINPAKIIGMVNDFTGIRNIEIGEIEILKTFSFFEAQSEFTNEILEGFKGRKLKNRQIGVEVAGEKREKKRNSRNERSNGNRNFRNFEKKKNNRNRGKRKNK